jgi:recombination protein RecT
MFEYQNGFIKAMYWSREKMEAHALKYSQGYASDKKKGTAYTFWSKDFDSMAYKTMLRQLISKWGIMSIDMQDAYTKDMAVLDEKGTANYVDNGNDFEIINEPAGLLEENKNPIDEETAVR